MPPKSTDNVEKPAPIMKSEIPRPSRGSLMVAHRCGAGLGPENTCSAIVQSSFYRPDYYEIDLRHTSDGVPVCLHDSTLDRTTDAEGELTEITYEELTKVDAGGWFDELFKGENIPTLSQMLDCVNPSPLAIELKEADITIEQCQEIADQLRERGDISSVVMSFEKSALDTYRSVDPNRRIGLISREFLHELLSADYEIIALQYSACTEEIVHSIQEAGKAVWVWTVDEDYLTYLEMGVDAIVTNHPDRYRAAAAPS